MAVTVDYDSKHRWFSAGTWSKNRPYSYIKVRKKNSNASVDLWALVDTGADYLCLSDDVAKQLGINLTLGSKSVKEENASGRKIIFLLKPLS
jgi:predicted aspartyl protease